MTIDFRIRPPYGGYLNFFEGQEMLKSISDGADLPFAASIQEKSLDLFFQEFNAAGIDHAVIPGRGILNIDNNELIEFANQHAGKFSIFPFIDPLQSDSHSVIEEIKQYFTHDVVKGIAIENGVGPNPFEFNDERVYPFYQYLQDNDIPLLVTISVLTVPYIDNNVPKYLDLFLEKFPTLNVILAHAAWPWVNEVTAIAYKRKNLFLIPDMYGINFPGAQDYISAANSVLKDQIVYGSSYPILPIEETKAYYESQIKQENHEKIFNTTAAKLLKLTVPSLVATK